MPAPDARKPSNQQPHKPTGIETLNEATRRYLCTVLEHADWIGRELGLCLSASYRPDAVLADGYCKALRWRLRPTVRADRQIGVGQVDGVHKVMRLGQGQQGLVLQAGEQIDMDALAGYGVEPISFLSMLSRSGLGEDFPRATSWLCRLLDQLPADVWTKEGQPPAASIVEDWRKATEMLHGCLASRLAGMPDDFADVEGPDTPVTLQEFMEVCCFLLPKKLLTRRVESLKNAAESRKVALPEYVTPWRRGQSRKYPPSALKRAWPRLKAYLPDLPDLKAT